MSRGIMIDLFQLYNSTAAGFFIYHGHVKLVKLFEPCTHIQGLLPPTSRSLT